MNMYNIIRKKRDGEILSPAEIAFWIKGCVAGEIPDYQSSALLMAAFINGFNRDETIALTAAMINSGKTVDLSSIAGIKADKHSSGGVGDKTTLLVLPMIAAAGIKAAKMSGRGLGHTGGTIDKLESIPGFKAELSREEFLKNIAANGFAIASQSADLAPADKLLYALRDVTATVDYLPFIAASIMSKKIASGSDIIILDIKYGSGAFLKTPQKAAELAEVAVNIGEIMGKKTCCVLTSMDEPLGSCIGNALEVREIVDILQTGAGDERLIEVSVVLAGEIIYRSGLTLNREEGCKKAIQTLRDGSAREKFRLMIKAQGGEDILNNPALLPEAAYVFDIISPKKGCLISFNTEAIGFISLALGAGRKVKNATINYGAGIKLHKRIGDHIEKGDVLASFYSDNRDVFAAQTAAFYEAIIIGDETPLKKPLIAGYAGSEGFEKCAFDRSKNGA
jgi:pyrimidine-nucleoside phosphorylase